MDNNNKKLVLLLMRKKRDEVYFNCSNYIYYHLHSTNHVPSPMYHADDASGRDKVASIQIVVSSSSASAVVVRKTAAVPVVELVVWKS